MSETKQDKGKLLTVTVNLCRLLLGACFVFSGFVKAVDPVGTQIKLSDYVMAFGMTGLFHQKNLLFIAGLMAAFEFLLGVYMLLGIYKRGTSLLLLVVMAVFTPFTLYLAIANPVSDCGCFGDALVLTNWQTFSKNVFLLALAIYVFVCKKHISSMVSQKRMWMVSAVTVVLIVQFVCTNIRDLPVFDFRPYKVGTDLREAVVGGDLRYSDFMLMDQEFDDMTEGILEDSGYTMLLIAPYLEDASVQETDLIDDLYDYCLENGYSMYGVTASPTDMIDEWIQNTGAEYEFLIADEIPLQTMIRSNPGLVVLHDGKIVAKYSHSNIPSEEQLSLPLEEMAFGQAELNRPGYKVVWVILMFILPYVLVLLLDGLALVSARQRNDN